MAPRFFNWKVRQTRLAFGSVTQIRTGPLKLKAERRRKTAPL